MLNWLGTNKQWLFSGVGVTVFLLIGGIVRWFVTRKKAAVISPPPSVSTSSSQPSPPLAGLTIPTPDQMMKQVNSLPPFQQKAAWDAYKGLEVRWQAIFNDIHEDPRTYPQAKNKKATKKWVVYLKHYDPVAVYSSFGIDCYGISLEAYPQLKIMHNDEVVIVSGTVTHAGYTTVLQNVKFEFPGRRIKKPR